MPSPSYATVGSTKRSAARRRSTSSSSGIRPRSWTRLREPGCGDPVCERTRERAGTGDRDAQSGDVSEQCRCVDQLFEPHPRHEAAHGENGEIAVARGRVASATRPGRRGRTPTCRRRPAPITARAAAAGSRRREQRPRVLAQDQDARRPIEAPALEARKLRLQRVAGQALAPESDPRAEELELQHPARVEERDERRIEAGRQEPGRRGRVVREQDVELPVQPAGGTGRVGGVGERLRQASSAQRRNDAKARTSRPP